MIEILPDLPEGTLGFGLFGTVSREDYDTVLVPALERAIEEHERVKLLMRFGEGFEGYTPAAAWEDTLAGLRHWRGFERIAVVSEVPWLRTAVAALAPLFPCPVRLFGLPEEDQARLWLSESLGTIHLEPEDGVIRVRLIGRLEPSAYARIEKDLDGLLSRVQPVRLLIDLRQFDGWTGLAALGDHLSLVREHRLVPQRVAVLGDAGWQKLAQKLASRFVRAETRFFDGAHAEQARVWASASG
ncbi:MAG: STAS/SEC14 domain-containing protein [Synechococcaceae cyanobacterium]|nr:STAS/SEC14 domain-containing protein [Synechococcaceae cyanobacterium]